MEPLSQRSCTNWEKIRLLMWKNYRLQSQHKLQALMDLIVPIVFCGLLLLIRTAHRPTRMETSIYKEFGISSLNNLSANNVMNVMEIAYSPKNRYFTKLIQRVRHELQLDGYIAVDDAAELETILMASSATIVAGIEFHHSANIIALPKDLVYSLRFPGESRTYDRSNWKTDELYPPYNAMGGPRHHSDNQGGEVFYAGDGFLAIQQAIAVAYVRLQSEQEIPDITLARFPYASFDFDPTSSVYEFMMAFFIILGFISPTTNLVKYIAIEKEKQLKEAMKIMGLPNWLHWASWFAKSMIYMTITITMIVLLFKKHCYANHSSCVLNKVDVGLLWIFLFIYSIATTMYCFMLSVFFSKANTAARVAGFMFSIFYIPYSLTQNSALTTKLIACIFSNSALPYGIQIILRYEKTSEGLQWSNLWEPITVGDSLTMGHVLILLLTSSFVYLMITLYVEKVFPGSYGVPEKWYFPIRKDFWFPNSGYVAVGAEQGFATASANNKDYEEDPAGLRAGVQVKGLRKVYANKKAAVEGLTINMYEDQITVLLGHNGAGKTTTMSMLTGMFPPTSGTALINGYDIRSNIYGARESLGLCPQHNILFDELTVREHIIFYSHLKGLRGTKVAEEVRKYVKLLELEPKMNALSNTLSGGMKRKLSVGVSLCGGSKVVLCDEPSSGMDPAARRALWDVLQAEKKGRTILLSTHFMDEADILGDRIAIMAGGQLKCYGSSFFLKKRFGTGYHLICVKNDECKPSNVTNLIRKFIPGIEIGTNIGSELSYELPKEKAKEFALLLADLEEKSESLELFSYGVSLTTLEEVFMKIGTDNLKNNDAEETSISNGSTAYVLHGYGGLDLENGTNNSVKLLTGFPLILNQCLAMFKKKSIYTFRQWKLLLFQFFIAISFVVMSLLSVKSETSRLPPLEISLGMHEQSVTTLDTHLKTPSNLITKITDEYEAYVLAGPKQSSLVTTEVEFVKHILMYNESRYKVDSKYFAAVSFEEDDKIIAWFNNEAYHTAPLSLNLVHNAVVRAILGEDHSIRVFNKPLPFKADTSRPVHFSDSNEFVALLLSMNIGMAMVFVSAFYVIFYIKERKCRAKLLQMVSGVNVFTFWMVAFLWDFFTFLITIILMIATMAGFQREGWSTPEELGRVFIVLAFFGFAMLPMTFIASRFFSVPSTGFSRMTTINVFIGIVIYMVIYVLTLFRIRDDSLRNLVLALKYIFMAYPHCSLSDSLINLNLCAAKVSGQCDFFGWEHPGLGQNIAYFVGTGVGCFVIHLILEYQVLNGLVYKILRLSSQRRIMPAEMKDLDEDVYNEKQRVNLMSEDGRADVDADNLVLKEVSKFYKNFLAVKDISIGIKHSECFGLLGVNGAGKTSLFKMLTGDVRISSGQAWVRGVSLKENMNVVNKVIGYCPQFDALLEEFTGRETLEIFCLLRGVPRGDVKDLSLRLANDLNFVPHLDKKISEYSGGNKRKLSTAIALIGNPVVLYLDEPTTGMDPGAKRHLWNMVCKVRNSGTSIVLTSHSMEECEALCTRLAIMVNGEFKCLGSTQYLKNKFSKGYVLTVKKQNKPNSVVSPPEVDSVDDVASIKEYISSNFLGASLKEEYQGMLIYYVPPTDDLKWSTMFGLMETAKETLNIEDYSISQTSLEQVFLSFTKFQSGETAVGS